MYGWKNIASGEVSQGHVAATADVLFENAGFGAVDVDKPIKGFLAVEVEYVDGRLVEAIKPATGA